MLFKHYTIFVLFFASIHIAYADEYGTQRKAASFAALYQTATIAQQSTYIPRYDVLELATVRQEFAKIIPYKVVQQAFVSAQKALSLSYSTEFWNFSIGISPRSLYNGCLDGFNTVCNKMRGVTPYVFPDHAEQFTWQNWASYCLNKHGVAHNEQVTFENYFHFFTKDVRLKCLSDLQLYRFPEYLGFLQTFEEYDDFVLDFAAGKRRDITDELQRRCPNKKELKRILGYTNLAAQEVAQERSLQEHLRLQEEERCAAINQKLQSIGTKKELAEQEELWKADPRILPHIITSHDTAHDQSETQVLDAHPLTVTRHEAVENFVAGNDTQEKTKTTDLSKESKQLLQQHGVPLQFFTEFKGFEVQFALHAEYIYLLDETTKLKDKKLQDVVVEGIIVGTEANKLGYLPTSCQIADFCHKLLNRAKIGARIGYDFTVGAVQGAWHAVTDTAHAIVHPVDTVTAMAKGAAWLGKEIVIMLERASKQQDDYDRIMVAHLMRDYDMFDKLTEKFEREEVPYLQECNTALNRRVELFMQMSAKEKGEFFSRIAVDTYLTGRVFAFASKVSALTKAKIIDIARRAKAIRQAEAALADTGFAKKASGLASETATAGGPVVGQSKINVPGYDWPMPKQLAESISRLNPYFKVVLEDVAFAGAEFTNTCKGFAEAANKFIKFDYKHLFSLEFNVPRKGQPQLQGLHHDMHGTLEKSGEIKLTNKRIDDFGCYEADIEVVGAASKPDKTFFPQSWSRRKVIEKIHEAYDEFIKSGMQGVKKVPGNTYEFYGYTSEGIKIKYCMTQKGKITTCFPVLK